jgi:hypothetical protein
MPDWQKLVRQRLFGLELDFAEREEVHAELAAHLEDSYAMFCQQGLGEKDAADRTLREVVDWQGLQRNIFAAKRREHSMKNRVHRLWIPGFLTLILSMLSLFILHEKGFHPRIVWSGPNAVLFYGPWLLSLPFFGALGACLSSQAGGSPKTVLLVSAFPVLALTMAFLLMFPIGWMVQLVLGRPIDFNTVAPGLLRDGIGWLLLPGAALLVGGLLVQLLLSPRSSRDSVIG